ncbi:MAG: chromate transporter [Pseudomonadota bacterium]|jgi:chromate transporter
MSPAALSLSDVWALFSHFTMLSLLAIGGAINTAPDIQRYLVVEQRWLSDAQFTQSVAIAQAAPGPNVLFIAVLGWTVGGWTGMVAAMAGILLPSTTLTLLVSRWGQARRESRGVRAFNAGMAPISLGLLLATTWLLSSPTRGQAVATALLLVTIVVMWRYRISPLWMIGLGAVVGACGWV